MKNISIYLFLSILGIVSAQAQFGGGDGDGYAEALFDVSNPSGLPIELLSFEASYVNGHVQLDWLTLVEMNSLRFGIERVGKNGDFEEVGEVLAAGNSDVPLDYQWVDPFLSKEKLFYRLRLIDIDGSFSYSKVVEIQRPLAWDTRLAPNPSNGKFVRIWVGGDYNANSTIRIKIFDRIGKVIGSQLLNSNNQALDGVLVNFENPLLPGIYFVNITSTDPRLSVFKTLPFIVQ